MAALAPLPLQEIERTLSVSYHSGNVSEVPVGYSTGWRTLPFACIAQTTYHSHLHLGQRRILIEPGQACVIPQGIRHRIDQIGPRSGISRFAHMNWRILGCVDALVLLEVPMLHEGPVADEIGRLCAALAAAVHRQAPGPRQVIRKQALGLELLLVIADASSERSGERADLTAIDRMRPVYQYIDTALEERITLRALARLAGLSPSRFHAVFKSLSGLSPRRFLQRVRMQRAQQLLIETELPIKQVAAAVGHPDEFHFSRTFRQHCGTSPTGYRRTARSTLRIPVSPEEAGRLDPSS